MKGLSGKEWVLLSEMIKPEEDVVSELGEVVAQILANRGQDQSILDLRLKKLLPPHHIPNIDLVVERIKRAIVRRERIVLFGDYDVDGITGTALLYRFLKNFPITVVPLLPSRQSGYGLNKRLINKLSHYADLLITIDNGTTAVEELREFRKDAVVIDHHNVGEELPPAILLNPKLSQDLPKELKELSSVGLVFYLIALLTRELNIDYDPRLDLYLPAIGTLADFMPLNLTNRIIVSYGIKCLEYVQKGQIRAYGIKALMERVGLNETITSRDITFSLVPRINAPGRVSRPSIALKLFLTEDQDRARSFANKIEEINQRRRLISERAYELALKQALSQKGRKFLVVVLDSWAGGVAGLVAGRLSAEFQKPTAVFAVGDQAIGSVRSANGIDVYSLLSQFSHLYLKWGGHSYAMGLSMEKEKLGLFMDLVEESLKDMEPSSKILEIDAPLSLERITPELIKKLHSLEPFGEGFPPPTFMCECELIPKNYDENRLELKTPSGFSFISWDKDLNGKLLGLQRLKGKVVYQIDLTRPKRLHLLDFAHE
jgi:single-stranded-DNA-specific exonuclease